MGWKEVVRDRRVIAGGLVGLALVATLVLVRAVGDAPEIPMETRAMPTVPGTTCDTYVSVDIPQVIPDNNPIGITSTLTVADSDYIAAIEVMVTISHTAVNDLQVYLLSPEGTQVLILDRVDSDGDDFVDTTLYEGTVTPIASALATNAPFTGDWKPSNSLDSFVNEDPAGDWTLWARDVAWNDTGSIREWQITICRSVNTVQPPGTDTPTPTPTGTPTPTPPGPCSVYDMAEYAGTVEDGGSWAADPFLPLVFEDGYSPWCDPACPAGSGIWGNVAFTVAQPGNVTDITMTITMTGDYPTTYAKVTNPQSDVSYVFYCEGDPLCGVDDHECQDADVILSNDLAPDVSSGCSDTEPCSGSFGPWYDDFVLGKAAAGEWQIKLLKAGGGWEVTFSDVLLEICAATNTPTPTPTDTPTLTSVPVVASNTPTPAAWVSEVLARPIPTGTPCPDWNLRSGCGLNDSFVEVAVPTAASLADYSLTIYEGISDTLTCQYTYRSDNWSWPLKVIWLDQMNDETDEDVCEQFPVTGTIYLYNTGDELVDTRVFSETIPGDSWAAEVYTDPGGTWADVTPSPGKD